MNVLPGQDVLLELEAGNEMIIGSIDLLLAPEDNWDDFSVMTFFMNEDGEDNDFNLLFAPEGDNRYDDDCFVRLMMVKTMKIEMMIVVITS